jgi:hypothetical protein
MHVLIVCYLVTNVKDYRHTSSYLGLTRVLCQGWSLLNLSVLSLRFDAWLRQ